MSGKNTANYEESILCLRSLRPPLPEQTRPEGHRRQRRPPEVTLVRQPKVTTEAVSVTKAVPSSSQFPASPAKSARRGSYHRTSSSS